MCDSCVCDSCACPYVESRMAPDPRDQKIKKLQEELKVLKSKM